MFDSRRLYYLLLVVLGAVFAPGCKDDLPTSPVIDEVKYGETTIVVMLNPVINDANEAALPSPGIVRSGVRVSVEGGPSDTTDASGIAVLAPVTPGTRTLSFSGGGIAGQVILEISEGDLREIAVAADGSDASIMANVQFAFRGVVREVTPSMSQAQVNAILSESNAIVFFASGFYHGDLQFSGSNATLFGQGPRGGNVTIDGNVILDGSRNRIRGAIVNGNLSVPGSNAGISFGRVHGNFDLSGSDGTLLSNQLCGASAVTGSGARLLTNGGLAPLSAQDCQP